MTADDLSPADAAAELGVTVRTVQRWIADGRLPARRVGSRMRLSRSSLRAVADAMPDGAPDEPPRPVRALLVANRGEIAARIARTARRLGVRTLGLTAAGERAPDGMDAVARIASYLDADGIISAARHLGADAIHPGYGFLAEDPRFADAVVAAGLTWIGPPAEAIAAMGDKAAARRHAAAHDVPVLAGYDGEAQDLPTLITEADRIGYPLLLKPSAGGGGKGMRVVRDRDELPEAVEASRREADRAFGDDRLVLERFVAGGRHVEIQVLFDTHGSGVSLGERDCSAQRRNQKIVEEAPSPAVGDELRRRMGDAAVRLASSVGYVGAGTVEMLLADDGTFAFLEMNTRLQVEHPVTEEVTGRDLVADQLRIAEGATLRSIGLAAPPRLRGHAIEARLYAEDPEAGFLPAIGRVGLLRWPADTRIETGIREGDVVNDRFDPMLAKLVVSGRTREDALAAMDRALAATVVLGVRTNVRFLRRLVASDEMQRGDVRTDTVTSAAPPEPAVPDARHWAVAARALRPTGSDPWDGGWRLNAAPILRIRTGDEERVITITPGAATTDASAPATVRDGDLVHVDVEGQSVTFEIAPAPTVEDAVRHAASAGHSAGTLVAPMPGRVIGVRVAAGDGVTAGQPIVLIEAMKMEHAVTAPVAGRVTRILAEEGRQVDRGEVVAEMEAEAPQSSS